MSNKKRINKYIKFVKKLLHLLERLNVKKYWNKFSKKTYTIHQWIVLLVLRALENKSYERFVEWLEVSTKIIETLELKDIPHFTSLQKEAKKISNKLLDTIVASFTSFRRVVSIRVGNDSTGFSPTHASLYYTDVIERIKHKKKKKGRPPKKRKIRKHIKCHLAVDLISQLILADKIRRGPANDNPDAIPVLTKMKKNVKKKIKSVDMDKGYDAEYNHKFVVEDLQAEDRIRLKNKDVPIHRTKGTYRKKAKKRINKLRKNFRAIDETVNSVLKRIMGSTVRAQCWNMQNKEIKFKELAYNAYRIAWHYFLEIQRISREPVNTKFFIALK